MVQQEQAVQPAEAAVPRLRLDSQDVVVPFAGGSISAVLDPATKIVYVSVPYICRGLGVDVDSQTAKLRKHPNITPVMITGVAQDGARREVMAIELKFLSIWLLTINPKKVATEAVDKLRIFQTEAADVLYRHFFGGPEKPRADLLGQAQVLQQTINMMVDALQTITQDRQVVKAHGQTIELHDEAIHAVGETVIDLYKVRQTALNRLAHQPKPTVELEPQNPRSMVNERVRVGAASRNMTVHEAWQHLYGRVYYRLGVDLYAREKNSEGKSKLDIVEELGLVEKLYALACEEFPA